MKKIFLIGVITIFYSCSKTPAEKANADEFLPGEELAELKNKKLEEASGLAASIRNPGLFWTHNDSGNGAQIFLINKKLKIQLTCNLKGVRNRDWEDISVGPGPDPSKNYVYVADIGDNMAQYKYKMVYRFEEPALKNNDEQITIENFDTIVFQLPDGKKDSEALLVDPKTKDLYIVSKREEPVYVYRLKYPYSTSDTATAEEVMTLPLTQIVAGDFSADGEEILLKNYQNVYYWRISEDKSIEETLQDPPKILPYAEEPQGEAITFARDGSGYFTISEKVSGEKSYLQFYKRK